MAVAAEAMDGVRVRCRASSYQPLPAAGFLGIGVADGEALSNRPLDEQRDELLLEVLLQHLLRRRLQRRWGACSAGSAKQLAGSCLQCLHGGGPLSASLHGAVRHTSAV